VKALREAWGSVKASELTVAMVDEVRAKWLKGGLSESTTDHFLQALRAAYRIAMKQERISRRPIFDLINPNNRREGFVDEDTFWKIHAGLPQLHGDVSLFAYRSAWRRDEVESLTWEQVDSKACEARLWDSKNGDARVLPLEAELWDVIGRRAVARRYETKAGPALSVYVFHEKGQPLGDWRKRWGRACREAGAPDLLFHDLRRSAVKNMVDAGIPQVTVMAISGHRSDAIFRRYAIRTTKETRRAIRATVEHLRGDRRTATEQLRSE
jgi:integrase